MSSLALLAAAAWTGCTVTESNYKTLSFFFDGVPDPTIPLGPDGLPLAPTDLKRSATYVIHKPFAEENCDACHQGRLKLTRRNSDICLKCHANQTSGHEQMHGPVAAGACLWCHNPHESAFAHLLKDTDRRVCTGCHTPNLLSSQRVPEHADASRACLECHMGHGGKARFMLREGAQSAGSREPETPAQTRGTER